jgi:histidine triad (HIT) family protein
MFVSDCVFCKIVSGELPSQKVYEDDRVLAFEDISPAAPVHVLIIPKKHIPSIMHLKEEDLPLIQDIHRVGQQVADQLGVSQKGFRLVNNCGENGGQTVDHLHYHLLGGRHLSWPPG